MSDLELLADTMEEWSTTSGDHHMLAAAAIRQLIKLEAALQHTPQPVVPDGKLAKRVAKRRRQFEALCAQVRDPQAGRGGE
jgi:hypothetical protein